jgi:aldose 1-epimerase
VIPLRILRSGELTATFAPTHGMLCASLVQEGEELLGQRNGLDAYAETGATMGIPLLYPWANRLGGLAYAYAGARVTIDPRDVRLDANGLPMHGLRPALRGWEVVTASAERLVAGRDATGLAGFPFDHRIELAAELRAAALTLTTTITATGDGPVPICFGHHPYLQLPGVPRARWEITAPVDERLELDARQLPTGERAPAGDLDGPLGTRTFDDAFTVAGAGVFAVAGGRRRIEVAFERGYPYAQVFAPDTIDAVCFEPMTAPTDALRHEPDAVAPGESFAARFSVRVSRAHCGCVREYGA